MKRLGYILGRRIRGDVELDLDPKTLLPGAIIAPGQRLIGQPEQGIYEESADKHYLIGTRMVTEDRVFHYSRAKEDLLALHVAFTDGSLLRSNSGHEGSMLAHPKGVKKVTYHPLEAVAENGFAEGILATFGAANQHPICVGIASNTEAAGAGAACEVTLKHLLPDEIIAGTWIVCYPNIYSHLLDSGDTGVEDVTAGFYRGACVPLVADPFDFATRYTVAGLPLVVPAGHYFWGQTWGPCEVWVGNQANLVGQTGCQREVFVGCDGGIVYRPVDGAAVDWVKQTLGDLVMDGSTPNTVNGDQLVFLRLAP